MFWLVGMMQFAPVSLTILTDLVADGSASRAALHRRPHPRLPALWGGRASQAERPWPSSWSMSEMASSTQWTISTTWAAVFRYGLVTFGFMPRLAAAA